MLKFIWPVNGFTFYIYRFSEVPLNCRFLYLGNICDSCNSVYDKGFLFPSLNYGMCPECGIEYLERTLFKVYDEDQWFLDSYIRHFESFLRVDSVIYLPVVNLEENDSMLWDSIRNRFDTY